jgi:SAM-dependent methyltransferase
VAIILLAGPVAPAWGETGDVSPRAAPSLRAGDVFALAARLGSTDPVSDSLQLTERLAFSGPAVEEVDILAFEENKRFVYAAGMRGKPAAGPARGPGADASPWFARRVIFLKPAILVVDDSLGGRAPGSPARWLLHSKHEPQVAGRKARVPGSNSEITLETLLPHEVSVRGIRQAGDSRQAGRVQPEYAVEVLAENASREARFIHVLQLGDAHGERGPADCELVARDGEVQLTVSTSAHTFRLTLPPVWSGAGEIEIQGAGQEALLERRVLPSGILPHGPEGTRLLARWDAAYRGGRRPGWDTGRPSSALRKMVEDGMIRPCRAVELGCGLGTNAVWLARQGFDVTAIDIAPTALARAEEKAREAGVPVRWLLADVLALPPLEPFDFVFDRGCYHGVRRHGGAGYVESLRRLTRPGALVLILSGSANDPRKGGGPPRVKEEEIRGDFSPSFHIEWLRETRFDSRGGDRQGAVAWSVLLRRKAEP